MNTVKTVKLFYLVYTIYTIFVMLVSDYKIGYAIVGLGMIWFIFLAFHFGYVSVKNNNVDPDEEYTGKYQQYPLSNISNWKSFTYIIHSILMIASSFMAARFYTGRGPIDIISGLRQSVNSYAIYQGYAKMANVGAFTLSKIPYVLMLMYCFTMLIWSTAGILLTSERKSISQYIFVGSSILAVLLFGVARGTNFEMYIVFVTIVYCILNREKRTKLVKIDKTKKLLIVGIIGIAVVLTFKSVVEARGYVFRNQICEEIKYDPNKFFSQVFPTVTNIGLSFFRYLGWGIFTIGIITDQVVFGNLTNMVSSLIPAGFSLTQGETLDSIVRRTIFVGTGWVPDYFAFVDDFGWILFILIVYIMGKIIGSLDKRSYPPLLRSLVGILIFLEMLSIPVGNFIIVSTPLFLSALYVFGWYILCKLRVSFSFRIKRRERY